MSDFNKDLLALGHAVIKRVRLSNAMGAPLVLVVLVTLPCLGLYWVNQSWPLLVLAAFPVIYFIRAFDYFMKNNPGMLRTEEHEEKMLQISAGMGRKGKEVSAEELQKLPAETPEEGKLLKKSGLEGDKK